MNILVLGATSRIGSEIAAAFAPGNKLILVGRNTLKLQQAEGCCRDHGAQRVTLLVSDLRHGCNDILRAIDDWPMDVIINSCSATSRLRDSQIPAGAVPACVTVDLLAPLELVEKIAAMQKERPLSVVFISTVLTLVKSPNRAVYSSLKIIQERSLRSIAASHRGLYLLTVNVGRLIPRDEPTPAARKLAKAVKKAFDAKKTRLIYGWAGRLLTVFFYTQPLVFSLAIKLRRKLSPAPQDRSPAT